MSNNSRREHFAEVMKDYAKRIASTKLHALKTPFEQISKCPKCDITMMTCTNQDIRQLRTQNGETSFQEKNILKCNKCSQAFSSDQLAMKALVDLNIAIEVAHNREEDDEVFLKNDLWSKSKLKSRYQICMEIKLMNQYIKEMKEANFRYQSLEYKNSCFVTTVLRNLHKQEHVKSCFTKSEECRMKIPNKAAIQSNIIFNDKETNWYDWKGNKQSRNLFTHEHQRKHKDCMVNIHNEVASAVFQCNTNVVANADGGSVMYLTNYISKSTNQDDTKDYAKAGKHMLTKLKKLHAEQQHDDCDVTLCKKGVHALIGAVIMSTRSHTVSGTLASYLLRNNGSRFSYSHESEFLPGTDEFASNDNIVDLTLTSRKVGHEQTPFFRSTIWNYLHRPRILDDVCVYDFFSNYITTKGTRTKKSTMDWDTPHPSKSHLKVSQRENFVIPSIPFLRFQNSESFGDIPIDGNISELELDDSRLRAMEKYAKTAMTLFVPFRNAANDLQIEGTYLHKLRELLREDKLGKNHQQILTHAQNCHSSFNAGRPKDALERITHKPKQCECGNSDNIGNEPDHLKELHELKYVDSMDTVLEPDQIQFTDKHNNLVIDSRIVTMHGSNKCGRTLLKAPQTPNGNAIAPDPQTVTDTVIESITNGNCTRKLKPNELQRDQMYHILHRRCIVVTQSGNEFNTEDFIYTGFLENIMLYALHNFSRDRDQEIAFTQIVSAFVLKLHDKSKISFQGSSRKRDSNGANGEPINYRHNTKIQELRNTMNDKKQFICFLSGAGGTGKSKVIHSVRHYCKKSSLSELLLLLQ